MDKFYTNPMQMESIIYIKQFDFLNSTIFKTFQINIHQTLLS